MAIMAERKIKRALISVYDKTGIVDFARALVDEFGVEIISTGGTATLLKENGIPVTLVEQVTGFPEMLDGRVKTLHPKIHAAILADRDNSEHMRQLAEQGIEPIDMVVVNLYPFEKTVADPTCTFEQAIEMIDIGGPCLLRAAAKNHKHVFAVPQIVLGLHILDALRSKNDAKLRELHETCSMWTFADTASYDAILAGWTGSRFSEDYAPWEFLELFNWGPLRYGENPHQSASLRQLRGSNSVFDLTVADVPYEDDNPPISFNNYADADAALALCRELVWATKQVQTCVFVKHTNPCGVGTHTNPIDSYRCAYLGDPNAAMGGVLVCGFCVSAQFAEAVMETYDRWGKALGAGGFFVEVWVAPFFDDEAELLVRNHKKSWGAKLRLLSVGDMTDAPDSNELNYRGIAGGMLVQTVDNVGLNEDQWKVVTKRPPTDAEMADLRLAWLVAKHTKSNAISICKDGMLIGNGAGQMSRVMSCRIATWLAKENGHEDKLKGSAAASDAFFPFPDGPTILVDAGVTALIQPGGSKNDDKVIAACDERDIAMIFTGTRHFKH